MAEIKLPYGMRNNELKHISQVDSGIKCECICPACGITLVAKKGQIKEHHFAHYDSESCEYAVETALHLLAKEILSKAKYINLPKVVYFTPGYYSYEIFPANTYQIDSVCVEKRLGNIIPDLIITSGGRKLLIEISVTNKIDDLKLREIKALGISAIEIELGCVPYDLNYDSVRELIINGAENKEWIYNASIEALYQKIISRCVKKNIVKGRRTTPGLMGLVSKCPKDKTRYRSFRYTTVHEGCDACQYFIHRTDAHLFCCGHDKELIRFFESKRSTQKGSNSYPV